ncbi:glycosyl transferase family group 2-domain-containing protein [Zopfochytrium polystomum]|nr:glycosyl transferase family group 2-domain-containing protein [Zopfochytrium polystomum]
MGDAHPTALASMIDKLPLQSIFQRLPGVWLLAVFLFGIFGPAHLPYLFSGYFVVLHILFLGSSVRAAWGIYIARREAVRWSTTDWLEKYCAKTGASSGQDLRHDLPFDDVNHVIVLPNYKENMDTLCETLDVLASHSRAITQYKVCLAMEDSEQGSEKKAIALVSRYADAFLQIVYTIHPVGLDGEIRGKSSNVAWATRQMAKKSKNHRAEIITVMDADTCFTEDYFNSLNYFFCVATPDQRKVLMFAPVTIFDRNAKDVPFVVRCSDIMWSVAVMSNFYPSCPVRFPCSAYSVSMDLAASVGFWDTGSEAIGEDMHMYLKCYFATQGVVRVEPIYSPASCCNIEGKNAIGNIWARFNQAKRHLWGSLDFGYALRKVLIGVISPESDAAAFRSEDEKHRKRRKGEIQYRLGSLATLLHRLLEAHIMVGHLISLIIMTSILIPVGPEPSVIAVSFWESVTVKGIHPALILALDFCGWVRFSTVLPMFFVILNYEKYHHWVGTERWRLSELGLSAPAGSPKVQPLGLRSQLVSVRTKWNLFDWLALPISGFLFQCAPQVTAQISQLWTDRLDYTVAAKPALNPSAAHHHVPPSGTIVYDEANPAVFGYSELITDLKAHRMDQDEVTIQQFESTQVDRVEVLQAQQPPKRAGGPQSKPGVISNSNGNPLPYFEMTHAVAPPDAVFGDSFATLNVTNKMLGPTSEASRGDSGFYDFDVDSISSTTGAGGEEPMHSGGVGMRSPVLGGARGPTTSPWASSTAVTSR